LSTNRRWSWECGFQQIRNPWACRGTACILRPPRDISPDWSPYEGRGCGCPIACQDSPSPTPGKWQRIYSAIPFIKSND